jgi:hypothetical protein
MASTNFNKLMDFLMKSELDNTIKKKLEEVYNIINKSQEEVEKKEKEEKEEGEGEEGGEEGEEGGEEEKKEEREVKKVTLQKGEKRFKTPKNISDIPQLIVTDLNNIMKLGDVNQTNELETKKIKFLLDTFVNFCKLFDYDVKSQFNKVLTFDSNNTINNVDLIQIITIINEIIASDEFKTKTEFIRTEIYKQITFGINFEEIHNIQNLKSESTENIKKILKFYNLLYYMHANNDRVKEQIYEDVNGSIPRLKITFSNLVLNSDTLYRDLIDKNKENIPPEFYIKLGRYLYFIDWSIKQKMKQNDSKGPQFDLQKYEGMLEQIRQSTKIDEFKQLCNSFLTQIKEEADKQGIK